MRYWQEERRKNPSLRKEDEVELSADELKTSKALFGAGSKWGRIPCAKLVCEGYDTRLLEDLCSGLRASTRERKPSWKRKLSEAPSSASSTPRKRSRVSP